MVTTSQALAVTVLCLLPGASYTFAYERVFGAFGVTLSDRLIRFLAASALIAAVVSGPGLLLYRAWVVDGSLARGEVPVGWFWLVSAAWVLVPSGLGAWCGRSHRRGDRWARVLLGRNPEPRAWDFVFRPQEAALIRLRTTSGAWLAGIFGKSQGRESYASGYPEAGDLYLSLQVRVDPETGEYERDASGDVVPVADGSGLLLRWEQVDYLEFGSLEAP